MSEGPARVLRPGHRIALGEDVHTVIRLNGTAVTLQDEHGQLSAFLLGYLLTAPGFQALDAGPPRRAPQDGRVSALGDAEQERIRWLEGHLIELETGRHPDRPPRAAYDLDQHSLEQREQEKLAEFAEAGRAMTHRNLKRLRRAYREEGLIGLADKRKLRQLTPAAGTDPRVIAALEAILGDPRGRSTVARSVMLTQLQRTLDEAYGPGEVPLPSRRTFYRLTAFMDRGRRNFVSEASRRTAVNRPERPFTPSIAVRPGEDVPIDTNKLDIMCRYADGVIRRAELTMAVDMATRSILAGIIAPTTKAVDAAGVLARMLVPEPMRPGWPESLHHAHSVIPHERLLSIDERFANAAAKPVIIPDTITCDRGRVYLSATFIRACSSLGISVQPTRPYTGSDKSVVERTFDSVNTLFCQHVAGYAGRDTTRRGPRVAEEAAWTVAQLQELFDEWVVAFFTDHRTVRTCPDLRLLIDYMSTTESGGKLPSFFSACRMELCLPVRPSRGPVASFGHACACLAAAGCGGQAGRVGLEVADGVAGLVRCRGRLADSRVAELQPAVDRVPARLPGLGDPEDVGDG